MPGSELQKHLRQVIEYIYLTPRSDGRRVKWDSPFSVRPVPNVPTNEFKATAARTIPRNNTAKRVEVEGRARGKKRERGCVKSSDKGGSRGGKPCESYITKATHHSGLSAIVGHVSTMFISSRWIAVLQRVGAGENNRSRELSVASQVWPSERLDLVINLSARPPRALDTNHPRHRAKTRLILSSRN